MGLFLDTITYQSKIDTTSEIREKLVLRNKRLKFTIPFQRNKSYFSPEDMQPLYDSLRLTDFNIKNIEVRSYSSIEGSRTKNIELQEKRASNIVNELQTFQSPTIKQKIIASENRVEFFNEISATPFACFLKISKIRNYRKTGKQGNVGKIRVLSCKITRRSSDFRPGKKSKIKMSSSKQILNEFEKAIVDNNLNDALEIQKSIFNKIIDNKLPTDFFKSIEIPEKSEFALLLNNQAAFKHMIDETDVYSIYLEFKNLQDLFPKNGNMKYNNLCFEIQNVYIRKGIN